MQPQPITPCDPRALSNLKHGLTGRVFLFNEAEQSAYDELYLGPKEALAPEGALEEELLKDLVDDRWRMNRVSCLESSIFAEGAEKFATSSEATGDAEIDLALSEGRVWQAEAKNLNLLSLYTSRFHRRYEKTWPNCAAFKPNAKPRSTKPSRRPRFSRTWRRPRASPLTCPKPSPAANLNFQLRKSTGW